MTMQRRFLFGTMALGLFVTSWGCTSTKGQSWPYVHERTETLTETPAEHQHRVHTVANRDAKAIAEDLDILFMTDRPSRLNRWQDR